MLAQRESNSSSPMNLKGTNKSGFRNFLSNIFKSKKGTPSSRSRGSTTLEQRLTDGDVILVSRQGRGTEATWQNEKLEEEAKSPQP